MGETIPHDMITEESVSRRSDKNVKVKANNPNPVEVHDFANSIIRANDYSSWEKVKNLYFSQFTENKSIFNPQGYSEEGKFREKAITFLDTCAPMFIFSLAGRESKQEEFCDQDAWLQFLLYPFDWYDSGLSSVIDYPKSIAFLYHSIHGALGIKTKQVPDVISVLERKYRITGMRNGFEQVYWHYPCFGIGVFSWNNLNDLWQRWDWITKLYFSSPLDYQSNLAAYYLALSINEYIERLFQKVDLKNPVSFPQYVNSYGSVANQAIISLANSRDVFQAIIKENDISKEIFTKNWKGWVDACYRAGRNSPVFQHDIDFSAYNEVPDALF